MNDKKSQMSAEEKQNYIDSLISENARLKVANDAFTEEHYNFNSQLSANEMFKELGYERDDRYADRIVYYDSDYRVVFNLVSRGYMFGDHGYSCFVDINIHKAITKQMEELGWLE